ncbi:MAG: helix-turn-helix transcriptional regulator [Terracidiphilus sp.]|jgi:transcriptional regulator with XRE-family HTH domain
MNGESFGELIRASRRRLNKSLQDVADALGVSAVYVSEVERGKRPPFTTERLPALAQVLELDPDQLKFAAWQEKRMIELTPAASDKEIEALVALARGGLLDSELDEILTIVNRKQMELKLKIV